MDKQHKHSYLKGIDAEKKTVTAYVSTFGWDRMDERFEKGAWQLANFLKNPVVMWGHDYTQPPIGKAISIEEDSEGLLSVAQFADDERSQQIFKLYQGGFLNSFSVGFRPDFKKVRVEPIEGDRKGLVYQHPVELLEYSAVSIPANPGALVTKSMAELALAAAPESIAELETEGGTAYMAIDPTLAGKVQPDFAQSLKHLVELAKMAKQNGDRHGLALLKNAMNTFQEMVAEHSDELPADPLMIQKLHLAVAALGEAAKNLYPDASTTVRRVMNQIDKALVARVD